MAAYIKRSFPRMRYDAPIKYAVSEGGIFVDSRMYNSSKGGMYFEPKHPIALGDDVYIVMVNYARHSYGPESYRSYVAKVKWCREVENPDAVYYGAGVQFLDKSHDIIGEVEGLNIACDMCGKMTLCENICQEDAILLCPNCFKHLKAFPDAKIKESIERFLMGNVI